MAEQGGVVPNMGIRSGMWRPIDLSHLAPDTDETKQVYLVVYLSATHHPIRTRDLHWAIAWNVPSQKIESKQPTQRILNLVTETGMIHQTNWGPMTKVVQAQEYQPTRKIVIKEMDFSSRRKLEEIVKRTEVYYPSTNGGWNVQDWVAGVLNGAVAVGLLSRQERDAALTKARTTVSTSRYSSPD